MLSLKNIYIHPVYLKCLRGFLSWMNVWECREKRVNTPLKYQQIRNLFLLKSAGHSPKGKMYPSSVFTTFPDKVHWLVLHQNITLVDIGLCSIWLHSKCPCAELCLLAYCIVWKPHPPSLSQANKSLLSHFDFAHANESLLAKKGSWGRTWCQIDMTKKKNIRINKTNDLWRLYCYS